MATLQRALEEAGDEYVAAMVERHGSCQATRDEAYADLRRMDAFVAEFAAVVRKHTMVGCDVAGETAYQFFDGPHDDAAYIAAAMAVEFAKEVKS